MTIYHADLTATDAPAAFDPEAALDEILDRWAVHVPDEDGTPVRTWHREMVPAANTGLVDELLAWRKRGA